MIGARIALLLLLFFSNNPTEADGVDDPKFYETPSPEEQEDPNFYRDFNPERPSRKYNFIAPPEWRAKQFNRGNVKPYNPCDYSPKANRCTTNIPEPPLLSMFLAAVAVLVMWKRR